MTQSRSFLLPPLPEPARTARSDGWGRRLASRTAWISIAGLLTICVLALGIGDDQYAPLWPLFAAMAGQGIGLVGCWAAEGWHLVRDDRRAAGAALVLLGPVVAVVTGGLSWIVAVWTAYVMS